MWRVREEPICASSSSQELDPAYCCTIVFPNAFTPNGDGKNDHWRIPYLDPVFGASVSVYNRFGKLVYQVTGQTIDWDGKVNGLPQASATYVYLIRFKKGRPDMKGTVTIIR